MQRNTKHRSWLNFVSDIRELFATSNCIVRVGNEDDGQDRGCRDFGVGSRLVFCMTRECLLDSLAL